MVEIQLLHKQGHSLRDIAKMLGMSRNTIRKYVLRDTETALKYAQRPARTGKLDVHKDYLLERQQGAQPDWIPATVLLTELRSKGYNGSLSLLRDYLRRLKLVPAEPVVRFETEPGKQMQVDWAKFSTRSPCISAFVATLGYSRMSYVEFVDNEKLDTLLSCLRHAFEYFGGVTSTLLFDNMKTVVIKRNAYGEGLHQFQKTLWDFAKHYGFIPKLCRPYRAQTKGTVERFIGYLRHSFYIPLRSAFVAAQLTLDAPAANMAVKSWLVDVANTRCHATLGKRPIDLFQQEKPSLLALPALVHASDKSPLTVVDVCPVLSSTFNAVDYLQHDLHVYQQLLEQSTGVPL
jgi:transposase